MSQKAVSFLIQPFLLTIFIDTIMVLRMSIPLFAVFLTIKHSRHVKKENEGLLKNYTASYNT